MAGEIRGKEVSKEIVVLPGRESPLGERAELPPESRFATMSPDLTARRRFEEGKRNALELEFNRSFEQFQRLAARKPGEKTGWNIRPITVEDFLFGISWAEKAMSQLKAAQAFARGTFLGSSAEQPVGTPHPSGPAAPSNPLFVGLLDPLVTTTLERAKELGLRGNEIFSLIDRGGEMTPALEDPWGLPLHSTSTRLNHEGEGTPPAESKVAGGLASLPVVSGEKSADRRPHEPLDMSNLVNRVRVIKLRDPAEFVRAMMEGTEFPDVIIVQGRSSSQRFFSYVTKMKSFGPRNETLFVETFETPSGHWEIRGSTSRHELLINNTEPELALKIHRELVEQCIVRGSEQEAWQWLVHESSYAPLLKEWDSNR